MEQVPAEIPNDAMINRLRSIEAMVLQTGNVDQGEVQYQELIRQYPGTKDLLIFYNCYRLRYITRLTRRRPRILVGGINYGMAPNIHTFPLLRFADVVTLQPPGTNFNRPDYVLFDPARDRLCNILSRLPAGYTPDLFWDCQVEHGHVIPRGLGDAPFPTVAGICHMWLAQSVPHVCQLFDAVAPLSKAFIPSVERVASGNVLDLPFGGNWGSFREFIKPCPEKTVDLSITFGDAKSPMHLARNHVLQCAKAFAVKYGERFCVEIKSGMPVEHYWALLGASRITVNVAGVNGPYNYRLCEAISAGALVFHYETPEMAKVCSIRDYFEDGRHLVVFNESNFEQKLLEYLEDPVRSASVAESGYQHLTTHLDHEVIFEKIFAAVAKIDISKRRLRHESADFHHGLAYWYQERKDWPQIPLEIAHTVQHIARSAVAERYNNLMVLLGWLSPVLGAAASADLLGPAEEDVRSLLRADRTWDAIRTLYDKTGSDLVARWNLAMLAFDHHRGEEIDYPALARDLEAARGAFSFDPMRVVLHTRSKIPAQQFSMWIKELNIPLMYKPLGEQMDVYLEPVPN
jgi:hypothetical protein